MDIENIISVYVKTDSLSHIIEVNSDIFVSDLTGWHKIDDSTSGLDRDKYAHAQSLYFDMSRVDENGCHNYKLVDDIVVECTQEDKQAELQARPISPPSQSEQQKQQLDELTLAVATLLYGGGENA